MIKDLDYYTGMVLEGYTPDIGFPVCTGGRYDQLIAKFGHDCPATGFVVGVERLMQALEAQAESPTNPTGRELGSSPRTRRAGPGRWRRQRSAAPPASGSSSTSWGDHRRTRFEPCAASDDSSSSIFHGERPAHVSAPRIRGNNR